MLLKNLRLGAVLLLTAATALACGEDSTGPSFLPRNFAINPVGGNGVTGTVAITDQPGAASTVTEIGRAHV